MCIAVFVWKSHPLYPLFLLLNRDEFHSRPTESLCWWEEKQILGGRDGLAGGTWLACSKNGRLAFVTNVREVSKLPLAKSRGDLPVRFIESEKNIVEFGDEIVEEAGQFNGFNLIIADLCSETMLYVTNRPKGDQNFVTKVSPGIHVLTNASLDTPWPKAQRLVEGFKVVVDQNGDCEIPTKETVESLMTNTIKDDLNLLPGIYPPEREYDLSSIFVDCDTSVGRYGTRSSSVLSARPNGEVSFYEKHFDSQSGLWKEQTLTYQISNRDRIH